MSTTASPTKLEEDGNMRIFTAVAFYWVVSISLVFLNKTVMSGDLDLDAPLFLTWTQLVAAVIGCFILSRLRGTSLFSFFPEFEYHVHRAMKVMPLTLVFLGMIVFNNLCLKYVEVSFYQVARSLTICYNVIFTKLIIGESTSKKALMAVAVVVFGYILGCDSEVNFSKTGVIFGASASAFVALNSIYVKKILPAVSNDRWLLMIYNNINAGLLLPVFSLLSGEGEAISNTNAFSTSEFWLVILMAGVCGFLINIATYYQIEVTSPLTHNISGTAKAAFQTVLALTIYGNAMTFLGGLGVLLVLGGSLLYAYIRKKEAAAAKYDKLSTEVSRDDEEMAVQKRGD